MLTFLKVERMMIKTTIPSIKLLSMYLLGIIRYMAILVLVFQVISINNALAREEIRIVGSSTVFPFSALVSEWFSRNTGNASPVVESTGTGGGFKAFCSGVGEQTPDIVNASRTISKKERARCKANGVSIYEIVIGYDGVTISRNINSEVINMTRKDLYRALAKVVFDPKSGGKRVKNPYKTWKDVNSFLPDTPIKVYGPPPSSGTRDSFAMLVMEYGALQDHSMLTIRKTNKNLFIALAHGIREDGVYIDTIENDNIVVQKLKSDEEAFGIFGYSYFEQNKDLLYAVKIEGTSPSVKTISNGRYAISRPLYFYIKKSHLGLIKGLKEYILEFISNDASGEFGYLSEKGLIPLPQNKRKSSRRKIISALGL